MGCHLIHSLSSCGCPRMAMLLHASMGQNHHFSTGNGSGGDRCRQAGWTSRRAIDRLRTIRDRSVPRAALQRYLTQFGCTSFFLTWHASARLGVGSARHGILQRDRDRKMVRLDDNLSAYGNRPASASGREIKGSVRVPTVVTVLPIS